MVWGKAGEADADCVGRGWFRVVACVCSYAVEEGKGETRSHVGCDLLGDWDRAGGNGACGDEEGASCVQLFRRAGEPPLAGRSVLGVGGKEAAEYRISYEA